MQLIGMLDSPYVRRAAIGLKTLGVPFDHRSISVFGGFDTLAAINPAVKAPTLVLDDGQILMDSALILQYGESLSASGKKLLPEAPADRLSALKLTGLALAACEKTVQIVYERRLRPEEKQHEPWIDRVTTQLRGAYAMLERELSASTLRHALADQSDAGITTAVTWRFTQMMLPDFLSETAYPTLQAFAKQAEGLPVFLDTPPYSE